MDEKNELMNIESKEIQPQEIANFASNAAKVLKEIVTSAKTSIKISGNEYLKFEAWQTIAKFYNTTVTIEWTKPIKSFTQDGKDIVIGYEARANVIDKTGRVIGSAESSCTREEQTWATRADFQIRSMAQTRSCAKALRQVFAWVVVLAGYKPTPAEEMDGIDSNQPIRAQSRPLPTLTPRPKEPETRPTMKSICIECGIDVNEGVRVFSMDKFKMCLCYQCQQVFKADPSKMKIMQEKVDAVITKVIGKKQPKKKYDGIQITEETFEG